MPENIFEAEWHECLEAHYMHVIRTRDKVTEPSLTVVMHQSGYDDSELAALRVRATMHMDDSGADFVPDMKVLEAVEEARVIAVKPSVPDALPLEAAPVEAVSEPQAELPTEGVVEAILDEEQAEALTDELIAEIEEDAAEDAQLSEEPPPPEVPEDDPDAPQQLSLF